MMSKWCYFTDHRYSQLNIFPFFQVINNISILSDQASIREPWILYRFLQLTKDPNVVREQDFFTLLTFVSANRWPTYSETQKRFKKHIDPGSSLRLYSKMSYLGFPDRFNFNFLLKLQVPFTITSYFYNYKLLLQLQVPFTITSSFYNYKYFLLSRIGEPIVWDFFRAEWDYLVDRFTLNDRLFGKSVATFTARFVICNVTRFCHILPFLRVYFRNNLAIWSHWFT